MAGKSYFTIMTGKICIVCRNLERLVLRIFCSEAYDLLIISFITHQSTVVDD